MKLAWILTWKCTPLKVLQNEVVVLNWALTEVYELPESFCQCSPVDSAIIQKSCCQIRNNMITWQNSLSQLCLESSELYSSREDSKMSWILLANMNFDVNLSSSSSFNIYFPCSYISHSKSSSFLAFYFRFNSWEYSWGHLDSLGVRPAVFCLREK